MDYDKRADELEREAERLAQEAKRAEENARQVQTDWESAKSAQNVPGAVDAEAAGPHNIDAEDPATGRRYGQEDRREEMLSALGDDAPIDPPDDDEK